MGLIALVKLLAISFDHLAWPVIPLLYPICASIRAIESNNNIHSRKLLTYWILFAIILLFEVTIVKLNQWLPLWHHIKLITTLWLVFPNCDGAGYVYNHIVSPCYSLNPKTFFKRFKSREEELFIRGHDDFLLLAEQYIKENGSQALEKLIEKSPSMHMEHSQSRIEDNAVLVTDKEVATTATMEVDHMEPNPLRIEHKAENENIVAEAACGDTVVSGSSDPKKSQKEWTCAVCQVTTTGETNLNDHLKGKKHKAKEEERRANTTPTKNRNINASFAEKQIYQPKTDAMKCVSTVTVRSPVENVGVKGSGCQVEQNTKNQYQPKTDSTEDVSTNVDQVEQNKKNKVVENQSSELWCDTCKLMCCSQATLASHLSGKKHMKLLKKTSVVGSS